MEGNDMNSKLYEVVELLDRRLEVLEKIYASTNVWNYRYRREIRTTINSIGIVRDCLNLSAHTYRLAG